MKRGFETFARFCLVGACGFLCDAGLLLLLLSGGVGPFSARLASIAIALCLTWALNRRFTFASARPADWREFLTYQGVGWVGAGLNYAVYATLVLVGWRPLAALVLASAGALLFNFAMNLRLTFRDRP